MRRLQDNADDFDIVDDFAEEVQHTAAADWDGEDGIEEADKLDARDVGKVSTATADLPPSKNSRVKVAKYVSSAVTLEACPPPDKPEFAVIGRSNVGKSSLINLLTKNDKLALTSKQPGKTKCINHFLINDSWYLVDLPGYGYAKNSRDNRLAWNKFTKDYFLQRESLVMVLLLVDSSIPPQKIDLECAGWMADSSVPFSVIFTKADKSKKGGPKTQDNVQAFMASMANNFDNVPEAFLTSASEKRGGSDVLAYLSQLRQVWSA